MRNHYKFLISLASVFILFFTISSCKKHFLDRQPLGQYTANTYPFPTGGGIYDQYIFAAYTNLRDWPVSVFGFVGAVSIRSDDADKGSTPADAPDQVAMDNFTITPTNGLCNDLWTGYYSVINKCNIVLNRVGTDSAATPQATKDQAKAEAMCIRAYSYFMLVRFFGNIPLVDSVFSNAASQSNIPQSSPSAIYAFIEKDLQFAAAHLPLAWDTKFIGRLTSGAANGLLAKVYLTEKKWSLAMSTAGLVINSGVYNLNTPYSVIFTEAGENSSESLFELQAYADANHKEDGAYGCQYANVQGVRGTDWNNLGWGFNVPSLLLDSAYEAGDPRKKSTILYAGETTMYGETFPMSLPNPRYNKKVYTNPAVRNAVQDQFGWWMNVRILRYADVVLMYAEAANEMNNSTEALAKLEMVRARARAGNNAILPVVTSTDQATLRAAIQHERRIELAMEHDRFFDLVRWGIAATTLHAAGKSNFTAGKDEILPIPQAQIDLSKGVLKQNPGY